MGSKINEILTGKYEMGKTIKYGDTDSIMASITPVLDNLKDMGYVHTKEAFVELSDSIADSVNDTFAEFLNKTYNIPLERSVIKCGREICADSIMFAKKKKYACLYFDKEGLRVDKEGYSGDLKIMGLETQRSDTPEWIQDKLEKSIRQYLETKDLEKLIEYVRGWRDEFAGKTPWEQGRPIGVNNIAEYAQKQAKGEKCMVPGHVQASINWNNLCSIYNDKKSLPIKDGCKIIVCQLKDNNFRINSIAYPVDQGHNLPDWFKELPFDSNSMVEAMVDKKVKNIFGCIGLNVDRIKSSDALNDFFTW